jgi:hypothetical protein
MFGVSTLTLCYIITLHLLHLNFLSTPHFGTGNEVRRGKLGEGPATRAPPEELSDTNARLDIPVDWKSSHERAVSCDLARIEGENYQIPESTMKTVFNPRRFDERKSESVTTGAQYIVNHKTRTDPTIRVRTHLLRKRRKDDSTSIDAKVRDASREMQDELSELNKQPVANSSALEGYLDVPGYHTWSEKLTEEKRVSREIGGLEADTTEINRHEDSTHIHLSTGDDTQGTGAENNKVWYHNTSNGPSRLKLLETRKKEKREAAERQSLNILQMKPEWNEPGGLKNPLSHMKEEHCNNEKTVNQTRSALFAARKKQLSDEAKRFMPNGGGIHKGISPSNFQGDLGTDSAWYMNNETAVTYQDRLPQRIKDRLNREPTLDPVKVRAVTPPFVRATRGSKWERSSKVSTEYLSGKIGNRKHWPTDVFFHYY